MPRTSTGPHLIGNRVAVAKTTTEHVQEDLQQAEAELELANTVIAEKIADKLADKLADSEPDPDLVQAVTHNEEAQEKLHEAAEDLQHVTDLLASEEREREQLEHALAEYRRADGSPLAGSRSGVGSESVIEHLRQLTRHRHDSVQSAPAGGDAPTAAGGKGHSPTS